MSYILDALKRAESERSGAGAAKPALPSAFVPGKPSPTLNVRTLLWVAPIALLIVLAAAIALSPSQPRAGAESAVAPAPAAHSEPIAASSSTIVPAPAPVSSPTPIIAATSPPAPTVQAPIPIRAASTPRTAAKQPPALGTLRDLPEHIQREIPPLVIGGYLYSSNPADRTVLINNRLLREGSDVAPGLVLERLTQNGMVLSYRGYRYRSTY